MTRVCRCDAGKQLRAPLAAANSTCTCHRQPCLDQAFQLLPHSILAPGASSDRSSACRQPCAPTRLPCSRPQPPSQPQQQQQQPRVVMLRATATMMAQLPRAWGPTAAAATPLLRRPLHAGVVCCQPPAAPPPVKAPPKAPAIPPVKRITRGALRQGVPLQAPLGAVWPCVGRLPLTLLPHPFSLAGHPVPPVHPQTTCRSRLRAAAARAGRT